MYAELMIVWYEALARFANERNMPVHWPNQAFDTPPDGRAYLRAQTYNVSLDSIDVCDGHQCRFLLQASIYVRDNTGTVKTAELVDQLWQRFPPQFEFATANYVFRVSQPMRAAEPVLQSGWMATPVTFEVTTVQSTPQPTP